MKSPSISQQNNTRSKLKHKPANVFVALSPDFIDYPEENLNKLTKSCVRVLDLILHHFNVYGEVSIAHDRIAKMLRIHRRTVIRSLKALRFFGLVNFSERHRHANVYFIPTYFLQTEVRIRLSGVLPALKYQVTYLDHLQKVFSEDNFQNVTPLYDIYTKERINEEFTPTSETFPEAQTDDGLQVAKAEVVRFSFSLATNDTTPGKRPWQYFEPQINYDSNQLSDGALKSIFGEQSMDEKDISLLTGGQYRSEFPKRGISNDSSSRRFFPASGVPRGHSTHEPTVIRTNKPHLNGINRYQIWKEPEPIKRNTFEEMDKLDAASQTEASKKFSKLIGFDAMSAYMGSVVKNTMT